LASPTSIPAPAARALTVARRHPQLTAWAIVTAALGVYFLLSAPSPQQGDAGQYWVLQDGFGTPFGLANFNNQLRGYSFPLLIRTVRAVVAPLLTTNVLPASTVARWLSLLTWPALLCGAIPTLARQLRPQSTITIARLLGLSALFWWFWRDDSLQLLSDVPGLLCIATAMALLLRHPNIAGTAAAGVALGLALNTRPAYLVPSLVAVVTLGLVPQRAARVVARTAVLVGAIVVVLLPQMWINHEHHGTWTPLPVLSAQLSSDQARIGMRLTRYGTYVGPPSTATGPGMSYLPGGDPVDTKDITSLPRFGTWAASHPLYTGEMVIVHLLNGLDLRQSGTFSYEVPPHNIALQTTNYLFILLAGYVLVRRGWRRLGMPSWPWQWHWRTPGGWFATTFIVYILATSITAIEVRFMLPVHLFLLATIALTTTAADLPHTTRGRLGLAVATAAGAAAYLAFSFHVDGQLSPSLFLL